MIGNRIREIRKRERLTQKILADKAGINKNSIARYESGEVSPTETVINKIAQALEVYPSELLDNTPVKRQELKFDDEPEFSMVFWGSVVDNAKKIASSKKLEEIDLILPLIQSAYKILIQAKTGSENMPDITNNVNIRQENIGHDATVNVNN